MIAKEDFNRHQFLLLFWVKGLQATIRLVPKYFICHGCPKVEIVRSKSLSGSIHWILISKTEISVKILGKDFFKKLRVTSFRLGSRISAPSKFTYLSQITHRLVQSLSCFMKHNSVLFSSFITGCLQTTVFGLNSCHVEKHKMVWAVARYYNTGCCPLR